MIKIGTALFEACEELERERGISKEVLISSLCDAMVAAYKKHMHTKEAANIEAILDEQAGEIGVFSTKLVVKDVEDPETQISLEDAKEISEDVEIDDEGAAETARRSRGTPRIANRLIKRVADYAIVKSDGKINKKIACEALDSLNIDRYGLDTTDRSLLSVIAEKYNGGPVGLNTLAAALGEDAKTIEEVYEPYLLQEGFIQRTPGGRKITPYTAKILNLESPQQSLF